jgi:tetratricopeptide (TPR) repeat protein
MQMGRIEDSRSLHEEALVLRRAVYGPDHNEVGYSVGNLAFLYQYLGDYEKAAAYSKEAIEIFSKQFGENHPNIGIILGGLGWTLRLQGRFGEAELTLREALGRLQTSVTADNVHTSQIHNALGETYAAQAKYAEAEAEFRESLRVLRQLGVEHAHQGRAMVGIASLPASSLSVEERMEYYVDGLRIVRNTEGLGTPDTAVLQINFGAFLLDQGEVARARAEFKSGLRHLAETLPGDNPRYLQQADRYRELFGEPPP